MQAKSKLCCSCVQAGPHRLPQLRMIALQELLDLEPYLGEVCCGSQPLTGWGNRCTVWLHWSSYLMRLMSVGVQRPRGLVYCIWYWY